METVSADRVAKKIIALYFNKLDQDTQQDLFHFVRNFITDEQEKLLDKDNDNRVARRAHLTLQDMKEDKHSDDSDSDDSDASDTSGEGDAIVDEVLAPLTPYDVATVDIISVYLHARSLYEAYVKAPTFVRFWEFYHDTIHS